MIIEPDFPDHWKTRLLVDELGGDEAAPVYLLRLWAHCQNRRVARFPHLPATGLKALCRYPGPPEKLETALVKAGFIVREGEAIQARGWEEYNASLVANWSNGKKGGRPPKASTLTTAASPAPSSTAPTNPSSQETHGPEKTHGFSMGNPPETHGQPMENPWRTDKSRVEKKDKREIERDTHVPAGMNGSPGTESHPAQPRQSQGTDSSAHGLHFAGESPGSGANPRAHARPTLQEAVSAATQLGIMPEKADEWWHAREASDWLKGMAGGGTTPVGRNWQADLKVYATRGAGLQVSLPEGSRSHGGSRGTGSYGSAGADRPRLKPLPWELPEKDRDPAMEDAIPSARDELAAAVSQAIATQLVPAAGKRANGSGNSTGSRRLPWE